MSDVSTMEPLRSGTARAALQAPPRGRSTTDDRRLVERAMSGDSRAIRALVDALTPTIQARVARALIRRGSVAGRDVRQEVEDLVQDVFAYLFDSDGKVLRQWEPEKGMGLRGFVGLITERRVASALRSPKRSPFTREEPTATADADGVSIEPAAPAHDGPERVALNRDAMRTVVERMERALSPMGFRVFRLLFCEERSPVDVQEELGLSADAVYAWRSRIRKTARVLAAELRSEGTP